MAKILIIDDQLIMVDLVRKQLQRINTSLCNENIFYFDYIYGDLSILSWQQNDGNNERRVDFVDEFPVIYEKVYNFLNEHFDEQILILIDVLLKSANTNAPSIEQYLEDQEFSCELYAELMKLKNGKELSASKIDPDQFFFMLFSRSAISNGVVATRLHDLYTEEEAQFFPCECYVPENISWCKNQCEMTDGNNIVIPNQEFATCPLALPDEYNEFIAHLT